MKGHWKEKLFGDKQFYKMVLLIAVPIMIQNGITNFVSLLDNIMVTAGWYRADDRSGYCKSAYFCIQPVYFRRCVRGGEFSQPSFSDKRMTRVWQTPSGLNFGWQLF